MIACDATSQVRIERQVFLLFCERVVGWFKGQNTPRRSNQLGEEQCHRAYICADIKNGTARHNKSPKRVLRASLVPIKE